LPQAQDLRGLLTYAKEGDQVPFEVKRYFLVSGVATKEVRGEHAHRRLHQFLVCVQGQCHIVADDGRSRQEFVLDDPALAAGFSHAGGAACIGSGIVIWAKVRGYIIRDDEELSAISSQLRQRCRCAKFCLWYPARFWSFYRWFPWPPSRSKIGWPRRKRATPIASKPC
jgi:hypothetical protein